jgi:hypothetical protein
VHFIPLWKRARGLALTCNPQCEALYALARVSVKVGFPEIFNPSGISNFYLAALGIFYKPYSAAALQPKL